MEIKKDRRMIKEDTFNIEQFGDSYKEYMEKVPMWNAFKGLRNLKKL
ncbi:MAG: hypothetical protein AB1633_07755 [Elusimicrobiota bacterium]